MLLNYKDVNQAGIVGDWEIVDTIYAKYIQGKSIDNSNPHDNIIFRL